MSTAEDRSDYHLAIPQWFPKSLHDAAHTLHARAVRSVADEDVALVQRLVGDERMKKVWRELQKRAGGDGAFLYEAEALIRTETCSAGARRVRRDLRDPQANALYLQREHEYVRLVAAKKQADADLREVGAQFKRFWNVDPESPDKSRF